jgi:hypothetical protein
MEILDDWTRNIVRVLCTGFKVSFLETTQFYFTFGARALLLSRSPSSYPSLQTHAKSTTLSIY